MLKASISPIYAAISAGSLGRCFEVTQADMDLKPIIATSVGIAIYRGVVSPLLDRYFRWRSGPRVRTARRNWRGIYVPDLAVKRGEQIFWLTYLVIIGLGLAIGWTVMTSPVPLH